MYLSQERTLFIGGGGGGNLVKIMGEYFFGQLIAGLQGIKPRGPKPSIKGPPD